MWIRCFLFAIIGLAALANAASADALPAVTLTQDSAAFTLTNAFVTARVDKQSGDLISLKYKNIEMLGNASGHPYGYWSHTPMRGGRTVSSRDYSSLFIDFVNGHGSDDQCEFRGN